MLEDKIRVWMDSARFVKGMAGIFILYDRNKEVIYIDGSENLQKTFSNYLDSNFEGDECKQKTQYYQREFADDYLKKKSSLLDEYEKENGKAPICNKKE